MLRPVMFGGASVSGDWGVSSLELRARKSTIALQHSSQVKKPEADLLFEYCGTLRCSNPLIQTATNSRPLCIASFCNPLTSGKVRI